MASAFLERALVTTGEIKQRHVNVVPQAEVDTQLEQQAIGVRRRTPTTKWSSDSCLTGEKGFVYFLGRLER